MTGGSKRPPNNPINLSEEEEMLDLLGALADALFDAMPRWQKREVVLKGMAVDIHDSERVPDAELVKKLAAYQVANVCIICPHGGDCKSKRTFEREAKAVVREEVPGDFVDLAIFAGVRGCGDEDCTFVCGEVARRRANKSSSLRIPGLKTVVRSGNGVT